MFFLEGSIARDEAVCVARELLVDPVTESVEVLAEGDELPAVGLGHAALEVHPRPDAALCDGPNSVPLEELRSLAASLKEIHGVCNRA